jgi:hypothetical protein
MLVILSVVAAVGLSGVVLSKSSLLSGDPGGCALRASSLAAVAAEVNGASVGQVVCLQAGSYTGTLSLAAAHAGDVTLQAAPGAHVTIGGVKVNGSHVVVRNLWIKGEVALGEGASYITIDHDDISEGGEGVVFETSDCTAPNAPRWEGCEPHAPVTNVVISANHIHDIGQQGTEDAIHIDNWRNVSVVGNEFDHIVESGNHTDCLQSVYGGSNLTFSRNYEHNNDCQGFFIKDGDATDVSVTENLFVDDDEPDVRGERFHNLAQAWNVAGLVIEHNTIWDGKGVVLVAENAQVRPSARVERNLISSMSLSRAVGTPYALIEAYNLFGQAPWSFRSSASDRTSARPRFVETGGNPYSLAPNPHHIGIDWSPASQRYGPPS